MRSKFVIAFLAVCCSAAAAQESAETTPPPKPPSLVAVAQNRGAIRSYVAAPDVVRGMVDQLVIRVTGQADVASAWKSLVRPDDRVGIKVSTEGGRNRSSHPAVVDAIVAGLQSAGVSPDHVIVWDRDPVTLRAAGFLDGNRGYKVRWIEPVTGYDPEAKATAAMLGKLIWGDLLFVKRTPRKPWEEPYEREQLSSTSHLCKILTREVTRVINVPVFTDSTEVGLAGCIYNMTVPNVDNWRRFLAAPSLGDPYIPELYMDERVGGKVVLHIMDGLVAQYASGPAFDANYAIHLSALYASRDPVAIDATAVRLLDEWRREAKLPPASKLAGYIETAGLMGVGNVSRHAIRIEQLAGSSK